VQDCKAIAGFIPAPRGAGSVSFVHEAFDLAVARLDVDSDRVEALSELLSGAEQARASRFVFARERRRFIVARGRLRELLSERLGLPPEAIEFTYGPHGKPEIAPACADSQLRFNLSHARDLAVYAFAQGRAIGVDVEWVHPIDDAGDIAARVFTASEREAYFSLEPRERLEAFFHCWTRKEAFVKAQGDGLSRALSDFDVSVVPGEPARILRVGDMPGERSGWTLHAIAPAPGFVGAVVVGPPALESPLRARPDTALHGHC
jgi:4'-phosphopantetheinyl transferase